jgi:hypothetical protein
MSTPQGPNPPGGAPDQPSDQPAWGQQPAGGWGQPADEGYDPNETRTWGQQGGQQGWQQQQAQQQGGQQWGGQQPGQQGWAGNAQQGWQGQGQPGQQPTQQQWAGQQGQQGWQQPGQQSGQQWGGQGYPGLPEPSRPAKKSALPWIIAGVVVVVLGVVAVLGFVAPGFFVTRVFDQAAVQDGVQRVLTDDFDIPGVGAVTCGEGIQVTEGAEFDCQVTIDGERLTVPVRVTDDEGGYEVGRPV